MNDMDYIVRENIRTILIECRTEKGITQQELSKQIGVPTPTIASWEQGVSLPNLQTLYRLAKYYQKTMDYMYGETKSPLPRGNEEEDQQKRS